MRLSRRDLLGVGVLGTAAFFIPAQPLLAQAARNRLPESRLPAPFQQPLTIPPVLDPVKTDATTDYYEITMRQAPVPIVPGLPPTNIFGYNGITPGRRSSSGGVRRRRAGRRPATWWSATSTTCHRAPDAGLHAVDVGAPARLAVAAAVRRLRRATSRIPGQFKDYHTRTSRTRGRSGTTTTASTTPQRTSYMGLAGLYHIRRRARTLPHPQGGYDVPLIVQDTHVRHGRPAAVRRQRRRPALFGDVILVNGRPWPVMKVERRKYRFRILNASISRVVQPVARHGRAVHRHLHRRRADAAPAAGDELPARRWPSATRS